MPKLKLSILLFACLLLLPLSGVFASEDTGDLGGNTLNPGLPPGTLVVSPTASVTSGTYTSSRSVTLTAAGSNSIRYTLDGTAPACPATGTLYTTAITVNSNKTLKAIACYVSDNSVSSAVSTYTYAFACATASVTNGTVGAYPGCAISCNSGYVLSGSSCVAQGGGGGGGGGSYVQPSTTTVPVTGMTIAQLQAEVARIQALILQLQQQLLQMLGGTTGDLPFLTDLQYGMTNNSEVKRLQEFLISKGFLASGYNTGNYYQLTANAVAAYQASKGITPTNGRCGPQTRAAINADLGITL